MPKVQTTFVAVKEVVVIIGMLVRVDISREAHAASVFKGGSRTLQVWWPGLLVLWWLVRSGKGDSKGRSGLMPRPASQRR